MGECGGHAPKGRGRGIPACGVFCERRARSERAGAARRSRLWAKRASKANGRGQWERGNPSRGTQVVLLCFVFAHPLSSAMPTTLPRTVRDAWGEEVADEFSSWLDENLQQRTVSRDEFREILGRLDVLEERFDQQDARFEERLEAQNKRFEERFDQQDARFEERLETQNKRFDERFDEVGARLDRMEKRFRSMDEKLDRMNERIFSTTRWLGLLVLFVTMATVLLSIAQFTG